MGVLWRGPWKSERVVSKREEAGVRRRRECGGLWVVGGEQGRGEAAGVLRVGAEGAREEAAGLGACGQRCRWEVWGEREGVKEEGGSEGVGVSEAEGSLWRSA